MIVQWAAQEGVSKPLLIAKMRNECPTVTVLDTTLLEKLQNVAHRFLRRSCTLEMRCISCKFAPYIVKPFYLFRNIGIYDMSRTLIPNRG